MTTPNPLMTPSHSDEAGDTQCTCCGAYLPVGRAYTCSDRCEAAMNHSIEEYINAAKLNRNWLEGPGKGWRDRDAEEDLQKQQAQHHDNQ